MTLSLPTANRSRSRSKRGQHAGPVDVLVRRGPPRPSAVFESYWHFAHERQEVYFRRVSGLPSPWTADPIIASYRFTNAYRAADRVSQHLIRNVIYGNRPSVDANDLVFRVLLFKLFNKVETWVLLVQHLGQPAWASYDFREYDRVLTRAMNGGSRIYSAAYIMPACVAMKGCDGKKHRSHLRLIEHLLRDGFGNRLIDCKNMTEAFALLRSYPMLGDFLAYQYLTDLNYGEFTSFEEDEFVIPGPGARDGLRKVFSDPGGYDEAGLIRWVTDRQEEEFARRGLQFKSLWGRRLQPIDSQNLFCEVGKYARVRHPEVTGISDRVRIKQKFERHGTLPSPWFPPKWGLNDRIAAPVAPHVPTTQGDSFTSLVAVEAV